MVMIFTITKDIKASNIELEALKVFFNSEYLKVGDRQSLNQFKEIKKKKKNLEIMEILKDFSIR